jgi:hypothetical protein
MSLEDNKARYTDSRFDRPASQWADPVGRLAP